jgi:hypothetical protein
MLYKEEHQEQPEGEQIIVVYFLMFDSCMFLQGMAWSH